MKGNKLDFHNAMDGEKSKLVYEDVLARLKNNYEPGKIKGIFFIYVLCNFENLISLGFSSVQNTGFPSKCVIT